MRALVTGGGARLGAAMARHLAARGFDVAVHFATSAEGAAEVVRDIETAGRRGTMLEADLLDEAAAQALVPRAAEALGGPLTCLVNNASIFEPDTLATAGRESWDRHMATNLRAPFVLIQALAADAPEPATDAGGEPEARALVVNMIDQKVLRLTPDFMSYTLAKSALWTLTQTAAQALAPRVRVNAIGPGPTLRGARQREAHFAAQRRGTLMGRGADPADVTGALDYLLGARAVTGQLLCVDGGQHLGWRTPDIAGV